PTRIAPPFDPSPEAKLPESTRLLGSADASLHGATLSIRPPVSRTLWLPEPEPYPALANQGGGQGWCLFNQIACYVSPSLGWRWLACSYGKAKDQRWKQRSYLLRPGKVMHLLSRPAFLRCSIPLPAAACFAFEFADWDVACGAGQRAISIPSRPK